ncbi:TRAP transporter substrate-binding protein [Jiella sonneratiae]|uniref:TRAP transporter substrate-binding protein n=1 Tax=Jiella sonneratiae TaxID=2816856 RepID=A0ABS3J693_9HYPH|nr:TRAP transporter substrate-binding protein [Jiella sonneratiae]MBO0904091.1 TRAP transporter substrate-binding protein [Jiella sonneratiae]
MLKTIAGMVAAGVLVLAATGYAAAQDVTLRVHQMLPPQSTIPHDVLEPWGKAVEEQSGGRIKVEHYPSMQLGGTPPELFDQARDGVVDVIWTVLGYTPGRFPKAEAFELPFIMTDAVSTSQAFQAFVEKNDMDEFSEVHLLAVHTHGPGLFHTKEPVQKLEDLKGMKIRGGSRVINDLLTKLGATPVGLPVPAVAEALSKGVIDGTTIPWEVTLPLRVAELVHNHTGFSGDNGLYTQTFAIAMNKDVYDGLPDDLKKVIDDNSGMKLAKMAGEAMAKQDAVGLKKAKDAGNNIITLDEAQTQRFKDVSQGVIDDWVAQGDGRQALLDDAKALIAKYTAENAGAGAGGMAKDGGTAKDGGAEAAPAGSAKSQ